MSATDNDSSFLEQILHSVSHSSSYHIATISTMAPRGRTKKVGLMRMDAAIDALKPMGYPSDFIRRKVKELLKVYGDDQGWPFIEEASYSLLIDYILEDGNGGQGEQGEPSTQSEDKDQGTTEDEPSQVEPLSEAIEPLFSSQEALLLRPVTVLNPALPLGEPTISPCKNDTSGEHTLPENSIYDFCLSQVHPPKVRKPCFGWIDPKDVEDYVVLKPFPVQGWKTGEWRRKHKSRWDVGPDDII